VVLSETLEYLFAEVNISSRWSVCFLRAHSTNVYICFACVYIVSFAEVAQLVEHVTRNDKVGSSILPFGSTV
jgi:hypothetical protein